MDYKGLMWMGDYNLIFMSQISDREDELEQLSFKLGTLKISNNLHQIFTLIRRKIQLTKLIAFEAIKRQANSALVERMLYALAVLSRAYDKLRVLVLCRSFCRLKMCKQREPTLQKKAQEYKIRSVSLLNSGKLVRNGNRSVDLKYQRKRLNETKRKADTNITNMKNKIQKLQCTLNQILAPHQ